MSYLTKLKLNGTLYDLRDAEAYRAINILNGDSSVAGSVAQQISTAITDLKRNSYVVVDELPNVDDAEFGVIYLILEPGTKSGTYIEYIKVKNADDTYQMEKIGTTDIDLSDYATKEDILAAIKAILTANEFSETNDILEENGYSYVTVTPNAVVTVGIDRDQDDENIVYRRENISTQVQTINDKIDQEIATLNSQQSTASLVTVEMENDSTEGIITINDLTVLVPRENEEINLDNGDSDIEEP